MEISIYLLSICINGIKNLKSEIKLDFYKKTVDKSFDPDRYRVKAIYGENGAGKSAIITSIEILRNLLTDRRYLSETRNQILLDNIINKTTKKLSVTCEILCKINNDNYVMNYAIVLEVNQEGIYEITYEKLSYKNGNYNNDKYKNIYTVKSGTVDELNFVESKETCINKTMNLLDSQTFIINYIILILEKNIRVTKISLLILNLFFFAHNICVYLDEEDKHDNYTFKKYIESTANSSDASDILKVINSHYNKEVSINEKDILIDDFTDYEAKVRKLAKFLKVFKPDLKDISINKKENVDYYKCSLVLNYSDYNVDAEFESTGIKKLIRLFDCFTKASNGGIVFIDELDSNVNDIYFCKLIEYFMYYGKGQLCFTTHNLDPMNVLKENKCSIDFLSSINTVHSWTSNGNATPDNYYKNGMIEDIPFNVDATDFVGMFEEE